MNEDDLLKITSSIEQKVGKEVSATIADDLGLLITKNTETLKSISDRDNQIADLQSKNEKLVIANGNLLQQIPMGEEPVRGKKEDEEPQKSFSWKACLDSKGNFIQ